MSLEELVRRMTSYWVLINGAVVVADGAFKGGSEGEVCRSGTE